MIPSSELPRSSRGQVEYLQSRGLQVGNVPEAIRVLSRINYFHLHGYCSDLLDYDTDRFLPESSFEQVVSRFHTDDRLRQALVPYLRSAEFATRVACSTTLSSRYGALGYENPEYFSSRKYHQEFLITVHDAVKRSRDPLVKNYLHDSGNSAKECPIWIVIELLSFGTVSKLYKNMLPVDQKAVAKILGYTYDALEKLLQTTVVLRNLTAHHSRLYGRQIRSQYPLLSDDVIFLRRQSPGFKLNTSSIFVALLGLSRLLTESERKQFVSDIAEVSEDNPDYRLTRLGFPPCWKEMLARNPAL